MKLFLSLLYIHFYQSMKIPFIKPLHISQNSSTKCSIIGIIHSGHYTASINCCKKKFYSNDHTITEFGITDKNSSIAYVILYELIDTWFLDSNRRVGVWSLSWRWHILSIPFTTGSRNKRRNLWVGRCVSSWWPWFPSRSSVLIIHLRMCIPNMSSVTGRIYIYNESVIQYWRSCTPSRSIGLYFWGVRGSWAECHFLFSLVYQLCLALWYKSNTRMLVTFGICFKQHFDTRYLVFYIPSPPRMFLSLDLLWEYRIQHGAYGPLYVTSSYSTWIFCRGVSGFVTDCPCGVWCRGLTTCLLHVGPPFGNRILNNSWAVDLT